MASRAEASRTQKHLDVSKSTASDEQKSLLNMVPTAASSLIEPVLPQIDEVLDKHSELGGEHFQSKTPEIKGIKSA